MSDQNRKLFDILQEFSTAMLVTHDATAGLRARPMQIADVNEACVVWFLTDDDSAKTHELEADSRVAVILQNDRSAYLSLTGNATIEHDRNRVAEIWKEEYKPWFPGGAADPAIAPIRVDPSQAEYWDNRGAKKVRYLLEAAGAYLQGRRPRVDEGDQHGKVNLVDEFSN